MRKNKSPLFSGKILANISLHEETHEAVFRSGWVGILAAWKQDPNLLVTLPATKALCNLDQKYGDVYMPGVYLLLPEHRSVRHLNELSNWGVDVVFIHGILGKLSSEMWASIREFRVLIPSARWHKFAQPRAYLSVSS